MRLPSIPSLFKAFYTVSNATAPLLKQPQSALQPFYVKTASLRNPSMPIPILSSLFSTAPTRKMTHPVQKSDGEWQAVLSPGRVCGSFVLQPHAYNSGVSIAHIDLTLPEQFRILREKGTEAPFTGKYDKHYPSPDGPGVYSCAGCSAPLYKAQHKFKSGCGWPAFFDAVPGAVTRHTDRTFGMERTEIVCSNCGGHLGHIFKGEGYATPTDERHCVNSVSINFGDEGKESKA